MIIFQSKPNKYHGKYRSYTSDQLLKSYHDVTNNKTPVKRAAMQLGVPITTLRDRILGNVNANNFNRETVLQRDEELSIVEFAETRARL